MDPTYSIVQKQQIYVWIKSIETTNIYKDVKTIVPGQLFVSVHVSV